MSDRLFERVVHDWLEDGSDSTPPAAIDGVLLAIKSTPQQRYLWIPRRFTLMTNTMRAAAGIAIVATVGVGVLAFISRPPGVGPPSPTATPTGATSVAPTVPPLKQTFTSTIHAIALSYPDGWVTRAATEPWTTQGVPLFEDSNADVMYDPAQTDRLFLLVSSQSLVGKTREAWATALAAGEGCEIELMEWDGGTAWIARTCRLVFVAESDIGWAIRLYTSSIPTALEPAYDRLFDDILGTVQLHAAPAGG